MSAGPQSDDGPSSTLDDRLDIDLDDDEDLGAPAGPGLDQLVTSTSAATAVVMLAMVATVIGSIEMSSNLFQSHSLPFPMVNSHSHSQSQI